MGRPGPPSPEQFAQVLDEIGLTEEQKARILAMPRPEGREGFRQRREQMEQILTPEQMEKMRDMFRSRMRARRAEMGRNLSPKDQAALERRFERRAGEVRGGRGGPGGGPGRGE